MTVVAYPRVVPAPQGRLPRSWADRPELWRSAYVHKAWRSAIGWRTCSALDGFKPVQFVHRTGSPAARHQCQTCGKLMPFGLPYSEDEARLLPLVRDERGESPACERCGAIGVEEHHWAPRSLFDDAAEWPTGWLCRPCHRRWHSTLRGHA